MTDAGKGINPQHFASDPAKNRIRIDPEIRIRIPDQVHLALTEVKAFDIAILSVRLSVRLSRFDIVAKG